MSVSAAGFKDPKQVILVRKDLDMKPGKLGAQVAHASVACLLNLGKWTDEYALGNGIDAGRFTLEASGPLYDWMTKSFPKICLKVKSEEQLLEFYEKAKAAGLPCSLIKDSGRTVFNGEATYTCVGIGPASREAIDAVTGKLKLY